MSSLAGMEKVAMSRFEADEFINDRYAAMEQRLQVRRRRQSAGSSRAQITCAATQQRRPGAAQADQSMRAPVCCVLQPHTFTPAHTPNTLPCVQIVRKRLNKPMTLAEKVCRAPQGAGVDAAATRAALLPRRMRRQQCDARPGRCANQAQQQPQQPGGKRRRADAATDWGWRLLCCCAASARSSRPHGTPDTTQCAAAGSCARVAVARARARVCLP
jgi:hypothetical protein